MAIFKTGNTKGKYHDDTAKQDVLHYILKDYKMPHHFWGMGNIDWNIPTNVRLSDHIAKCMQDVSDLYGKGKGVQLRHFILSFTPREIYDPAVANRIAAQLCQHFIREYQVVYAVHEDAANINIHIVTNSVSYVDGHRYGGTKREHHAFMAHIGKVLRRYKIYELKYASSSTQQNNQPE